MKQNIVRVVPGLTAIRVRACGFACMRVLLSQVSEQVYEDGSCSTQVARELFQLLIHPITVEKFYEGLVLVPRLSRARNR